VPHPEGIIEVAIIESECEECGQKHWTLELDAVAPKDALFDLKNRLQVVLDEWMTANGIMIANGVGPDGCRYDTKPN
jgi:hypothetical protein